MGVGARTPAEIITLPQGGGALRGIGETFAPDPQTGTAHFTVPIAVPAGRHGLAPQLDLAYSSGHGNGVFGLGWRLSVSGIARKTACGVPTYDDDRDTFLIAGGEDLVPVETLLGIGFRYRPRTEGAYARVVHIRDSGAGQDYWEVTGRDGIVSRYGTPRPDGAAPDWRDPAALADPAAPAHIFAWQLTETRDPLGNVVVYEYDADEGDTAGHRWRQPLLRTIRYADYTAADGSVAHLATVTLADEPRDDAFSSYTAGFEIRTSRRHSAITTVVHPGAEQLVRRYELGYAADPHNGVSLLTSVALVGFDENGDEQRDLPPLKLGYGALEPAARRFERVTGADPPPIGLGREDHELVDLTGDGLPDVLQLDGVARYWRNLGGGAFDRPRPLARAPAGLHLSDRGVQLLDADGDGRAELMVTLPSGAGHFALRFGPEWGRFTPYRVAPSFRLEDAQVRLLDLDGDGTTDALHSGSQLQCFFSDARAGWTGPRPVRGPDGRALAPLDLSDPDVHWADMSGDGLTDLVLVHDRAIEYRPNLGHGRWGNPVAMAAAPDLPLGYDPRRLLLGDLDGDGLADLVYADADRVTIWFNQSGNRWSAPIEIPGLPADGWDMRVTDLLGTGTPGLLWSRDARRPGDASMYFLDLSGGVKPRMLTEIDNQIGATTKVRYAPSTAFSTADAAHPATRWRTPLPFVVPVVARVETIDRLSGGKLTSTFRYRHGYWDGAEREFRGFGCVEQSDTETFADYHGDGLHPGTPFSSVPATSFSPPMLTRTWFHLGPVDTDRDDQWAELDLSVEYWSGDPPLLDHAGRVAGFLAGLRDAAGLPDRRARRDALRTLRGRVLRSELYARDGSAAEGRPYTVTEHAYELREEAGGGTGGRPRVFAAFAAAARSTQWERGSDPMTRFVFTDDHDAFGQPRRRTTVAPPRRSACRRSLTAAVVGTVDPDPTTILARHDRTAYATPPAGVEIHDRVAQMRSYELAAPPSVAEPQPGDVGAVLRAQAASAEQAQATFATLADADVTLIGHVVHHYDGPAYQGLAPGQLGAHGLLTRSEALVLTESLLDDAYAAWRPAYLGGADALPAGAPAGFAAGLGYRHETAGPVYAEGFYVDTACHAYDVQLSTTADPLPEHGVVVGSRDVLGHETRVDPDPYWLLPARVRDPFGLETTGTYDYRAGQPLRVTDPNGDVTNYRYHPLGLLAAVFVEPANGAGGTEERPEVSYVYDLGAFVRDGQPINTHVAQRVWHAGDGISDDVVEAREHSDGFGRLIQRRTAADELAFGDDPGLLVTGADGLARPVPGQIGGPAAGVRVADRVVVSGWEVHDNKGRVVERYEPFFSAGWDYEPEADARRGWPVRTFYDPRGQVVRVVNPDGSMRRTIFGTPADLTELDDVEPTPWEVTAYDENDLASVSQAPGGASLAGSAPAGHRFTPSTTIIDALGRSVCELERGGPAPATDWRLTRTTRDIRGNVLTVVDPLGRTAFGYAYDLADRELRVDTVDAGRRVVVLDARGAPAHERDARGCVVMRNYDPLNRVSAVFARDRPGDALTLRERLEYGDGGIPNQPAADRAAARAAGRLGRLWRHHDEAGLLTIESYDVTGAVSAWSRRVIDDAAIAAAEPDGWVADWAAAGADAQLEASELRTTTRYDALGRAIEIVTPDARRIAATYGRSGSLRTLSVDGTPYVRLLAHNARGQRVLIAYGDGTAAGAGAGPTTRYAYDPNTFRVTRLRSERMTPSGDTWTGAGVPQQDLTYAYDLVGNVAAIDERTAGCGVAGTADGRDRLLRTFTHDPFGRLVAATGRACATIGSPRPFADSARCGSFPAPFVATAPTQANAPDLTEGYKETYVYDPADNLLELVYRPTTGAGTSWHRRFAHGGLPPSDWADAPNNRLTGIHHGSGAPAVLGYDDTGHLLSQNASRSYRWDHAGRLVGFRVQAGVGTSVSARYLYGASGDRVKKWVRRGGTAALDESVVYLGRLAERQRWAKAGGGESGLLHVLDGDTRLAELRSGDAHPDDAGPAIRYVVADHLGSAALTLDASGAWMNREEYFPYGETSFGSFARKRYRYVGRERDEESGLNYHGARYYAPAHCRWTGPDPAGRLGGANPYAYSAGSPVVYHDPGGLQPAAAAGASAAPAVDSEQKIMTDAAARTGNLVHEDFERWQAEFDERHVYHLYGSASEFASLKPSKQLQIVRQLSKGKVSEIPEQADCITYVRRYVRHFHDELAGAGTLESFKLADSFNRKVQLLTLEPKDGNLGIAGRGMGLIAALREQKWSVIYANPAGSADAEYTKVKKLGYVSPEGKSTVPGLFGPRVRVRAKVDEMMAGRKDKLTKEQLERLSKVPFAVGAADFGFHTFVLSYGSVFEVHFGRGPQSRDVVEKTDLKKFTQDWSSFVFAVPPGW
jgi:RHS repeat-associated protein